MDESFDFREGRHLDADSFLGPGELSNVALTASPKGGAFVGTSIESYILMRTYPRYRVAFAGVTGACQQSNLGEHRSVIEER
jgi:hypothetical protein